MRGVVSLGGVQCFALCAGVQASNACTSVSREGNTCVAEGAFHNGW